MHLRSLAPAAALGPRSARACPSRTAPLAGFVLVGLGGCAPTGTAWMLDRGAIELSETELSIGPVAIGAKASAPLVLTNTGNVKAEVRAAISDPAFEAPGGPWSPGPGDGVELSVRFAASSGETISGELTLIPSFRGEDAAPITVSLTGLALADGDGDGADHLAAGGDDCDDDDASVHPEAVEDWYDGVDQDCDGNDDDRDKDGFVAEAAGGTDCVDDDATAHPGGTEVWYDGVDQDCDGNDADWDGDGFEAESVGGEDCDDTDPTISPDDPDPHDLVDNDCDGLYDEDDAAHGVAVLTEFAAEPSGGEGAQYVEIYNADFRQWQLQGWTLVSREGSAGIEAQLTLEPGEFGVLCAADAASLGVPCDLSLSAWPTLSPSSDTLVLKLGEVELDSVGWGSAWAREAGSATQLDPGAMTAADNDDGDAWCSAQGLAANGDKGSPGGENHACP